ncbi:MAG: hypothetical protein M0Z85_04610 [Gammaproteobacteria bacterium]|nr:hypothetical protein [Gammaproteobacteria bacterium]
MEKAFVIDIPVLIKSRMDKGRRLVEVEASNEEADGEGDVILQKALLDSAEAFIKRGHIDIDHISEIGHRLSPPVKDPSSFIIGRPIEVKDLGHGRTGVVSEIYRAKDGVSRPEINRYDAFWESLQSPTPTPWRASIYGFPLAGEVEDCTRAVCPTGASRWLVKGIDWRSLAFTRNPVNDSITGYAQIVTAKSWVGALIKAQALTKIADAGSQLPTAMMGAETMNDSFAHEMTPQTGTDLGASLPVIGMSEGATAQTPCSLSRAALWSEYTQHIQGNCPYCLGTVNVATLRAHYMRCDGVAEPMADILALALMHLIQRPPAGKLNRARLVIGQPY